MPPPGPARPCRRRREPSEEKIPQAQKSRYDFPRCTMPQLVECIPNFSEGRRRDAIDAIADEVRRTAGARLLDVQADESHNRCVLTFVGDLRAVTNAALAATRRAVALIDMTTHRGEHPRPGAGHGIPPGPTS